MNTSLRKLCAAALGGWLALTGLLGSTPALADSGVSANAYAHVANTNGDNINVREGAASSYNVKDQVTDGAVVWVLEGPVKDAAGQPWYRVQIGKEVGWIGGQYLAAGQGTSGDSGLAASPPVASSMKANTYAHVANTGGDSINLREGAASSYSVKDQVTAGDAVWVLEGPVKDEANQQWYRVQFGKEVGWIGASYLAAGQGDSGSSPAPSAPAPKAATPVPSNPGLKLGGYAQVAHSDGDAVRVRKSAGTSGAVIDTIDPNTVVAVLTGPSQDGSGTNWYQVKSDTSSGWVMAMYLMPAAKPIAVKAAPAKPAAAPAAKAAPAPAAKPAAAVAARSGQARGAVAAPQPPPAASASNGNAIVATALRYIGRPYVWGGTTPAGFDCSGFVYYVLNHTGIGVSRQMSDEINLGPHVSSSDLRPGDLVYFKNTYRAGISHIGIYVGNGKFVHAGDYNTGVEVTDLWSAYWAAHYAGAVRVAR